MLIFVASENIVKINAVKEAASLFFNNVTVKGIAVNSGVSEQPFDDETYTGAKNRVKNLMAFAKANKIDADLFVGIEGGIQKLHGKYYAFGVVCIGNNNGRFSSGLSPHFEIPDFVITELQKGKELGHVIDELSGEENTKQKGGAIGFLTKGVYNRKDLYVHGTIMAFTPLLNNNLFYPNEH